jgi:hypothetical protein
MSNPQSKISKVLTAESAEINPEYAEKKLNPARPNCCWLTNLKSAI